MLYFSTCLRAIPALTISQLPGLDGGFHVIRTVIWCSDFEFSEAEMELRKSDRHAYEQPLQTDWQISWFLICIKHDGSFLFINSTKLHVAVFWPADFTHRRMSNSELFHHALPFSFLLYVHIFLFLQHYSPCFHPAAVHLSSFTLCPFPPLTGSNRATDKHELLTSPLQAVKAMRWCVHHGIFHVKIWNLKFAFLFAPFRSPPKTNGYSSFSC